MFCSARLRAQHWKTLRHLRTHNPKLPNASRPFLHFKNRSALIDPNDVITGHFRKFRLEDIESVEAFVFFVGWQRSGHSIIGSLLDGHPDAIIAHEYFLFSNFIQFMYMPDAKRQLFTSLYQNSAFDARTGSRSQYHNEKGYNLHLPQSWQGHFRKLRVIGDKTAGDVTNAFLWESVVFRYMLKKLSQIVGVPLKVINVVRNPFDMIATLTLYRGSSDLNVKVPATEEKKYNNSQVLEWSTNVILKKTRAIYQMEQMDYNWNFLRMYSEDFIRDPKSVMKSLCTFIGLECTEEYLELCANKTFKTVSASRHLIAWNPSIVQRINNNIQAIPFLNRYSFDKT